MDLFQTITNIMDTGLGCGLACKCRHNYLEKQQPEICQRSQASCGQAKA